MSIAKTKRRFNVNKQRTRTKLLKVANGRPRLSVFKSGKYIYAQVIDDVQSHTIASASSLEASIRKSGKSNCNKEIAASIGAMVGKRAVEKGVTKVVFDKGGYKYHGVIKALADAARNELEF